MNKQVQFDELMALLSVDNEHRLETIQTIQGFRLQPRLTLTVPYTEYTRMLDTAPKDWPYLYRTPRQAKRDTVKAFLMDVLRAQLNELYFAAEVSRASGYVAPTHIRHSFPGAPTEHINGANRSQTVKVVAEKLGLINIPSGRYQADWDYCCSLCELLLTPPIRQINIF